MNVEKYGVFELRIDPVPEAPKALFRHREKAYQATGFYSGSGGAIVRFMPDDEGEWSYDVEVVDV